MNWCRPIKCIFCQAEAANLTEADRARWDWFTGYNKAPTYACGNCLGVKADAFAKMRERAYVNPKESRDV